MRTAAKTCDGLKTQWLCPARQSSQAGSFALRCRSYPAFVPLATVAFSPDELRQRMALWGDACWMCGGPFEHVDHVIPLSDGGWHCLANLRPACAGCNTRKGGRRYDDSKSN